MEITHLRQCTVSINSRHTYICTFTLQFGIPVKPWSLRPNMPCPVKAIIRSWPQIQNHQYQSWPRVSVSRLFLIMIKPHGSKPKRGKKEIRAVIHVEESDRDHLKVTWMQRWNLSKITQSFTRTREGVPSPPLLGAWPRSSRSIANRLLGISLRTGHASQICHLQREGCVDLPQLPPHPTLPTPTAFSPKPWVPWSFVLSHHPIRPQVPLAPVPKCASPPLSASPAHTSSRRPPHHLPR